MLKFSYSKKNLSQSKLKILYQSGAKRRPPIKGIDWTKP